MKTSKLYICWFFLVRIETNWNQFEYVLYGVLF